MRAIDDIIRRHPDRVPVKVLVKDDLELERTKYLVPKEMSCSQFLAHVRKSMKTNLKKHEAIFIFVENVLPPISKAIGEVYQEYANEDGMLYITLAKENTFG